MPASKWAYDKARTALTVDLSKGVTFSDGAAFDAAATKTNLDHIRTGSGPQGDTLPDVTGRRPRLRSVPTGVVRRTHSGPLPPLA
ncbi:hypothetical protein [Streptomyces sp. NBRC 110028]|uniref:hypothetical protein n=1 Tax=Streptomyces sp. NBRC 110028 TaxID=1621260 RepID=UPI00131C96B7|nr:hypothetical protein [Streptomyces sp. NBRC 110028]